MSNKGEKMKDNKGYDIIPNSIKLFENKKKEKESHPDYTGKMFNEDGVEFYVSCWTKQTKAGDTYLSGNIIEASVAKANWEKQKRGADKLNKQQEKSLSTGNAELDEDLPF